MTYSCFDRQFSTKGGWQVKETAGNLQENEQAYLLARVNTTLDLLKPPSTFPPPEEIAALPRRLVYVADVAGHAGYWHTAAAGADATGRPGNVFVHALLDRCPEGLDLRLRPIQLWGSPDWLCPYGPEQVINATLPGSDIPRLGGAVNLTSVLRFVLDSATWRIGLLEVLVDAVASALGGGPRVVLGVESTSSASLWIGAVSYLMSAGTSRRLAFSTYERARGLASTWSRGVLVAAMPRADLAQVTRDANVVVLDEAEQVELGDLLGAPHRTLAGSEVIVTEWSVLLQALLLDFDVAWNALMQLDAVADRVGDRNLDPAWPLAFVAGLRVHDFADAADEAAAVVETRSPPSLKGDGEYLVAAEEMVQRRLGTTASDAWRELQTIGATNDTASLISDVALHIYLARAIQDPTWLRRGGGAPAPPLSSPDVRLGTVLQDAVRALTSESARCDQGDGARLRWAVDALTLADFALRTRIVNPTSQTSIGPSEALANMIRNVVIPPLAYGIDASRLVAIAPPVVEGVLYHYVRPLLKEELVRTELKPSQPVGYRLASPVLDWLYPGDVTSQAATGRVDEHMVSDPLITEWALSAARRQPTVPDGVLRLAARALLEANDTRPMPDYLPRVTTIAQNLSPQSLMRLARAYPGVIGFTAARRCLERRPWSRDMEELAHEAMSDPEAIFRVGSADWMMVGHLARLRYMASRLRWQAGDRSVLRSQSAHMVNSFNELSEVTWSEDVVRELAPAIVIVLTLSVLMQSGFVGRLDTGGPHPRTTAAAGMDLDALSDDFWARARQVGSVADGDAVVKALLKCHQSGLFDEESILLGFIFGSPEFPVAVTEYRHYRQLNSILVSGEADRSPIAILVTDGITNANEVWTYQDVETRLSEALPHGTGKLSNDEKEILVQCRKFARRKWRELGGLESGLSGRAKSVFRRS